jgi:hypothetical protein
MNVAENQELKTLERRLEGYRGRLAEAEAVDPSSMDAENWRLRVRSTEEDLLVTRQALRFPPPRNPNAAEPVLVDTSPKPPPPPPEPTVDRAVKGEIELAERRLREREETHTEALARLERAKGARVKLPDSAETREELSMARAEVDLTGDDVEAARGALEMTREKFAAGKDKIAKLHALVRDQDDGALQARFKARADRVRAHVAAIVAECIGAKGDVDDCHRARDAASTIAKELGIPFRAGIGGISEARRAVRVAFRDAEQDAKLGERLRLWLEF